MVAGLTISRTEPGTSTTRYSLPTTPASPRPARVPTRRDDPLLSLSLPPLSSRISPHPLGGSPSHLARKAQGTRRRRRQDDSSSSHKRLGDVLLSGGSPRTWCTSTGTCGASSDVRHLLRGKNVRPVEHRRARAWDLDGDSLVQLEAKSNSTESVVPLLRRAGTRPHELPGKNTTVSQLPARPLISISRGGIRDTQLRIRASTSSQVSHGSSSFGLSRP